MTADRLRALEAGMPVIFGGDRITHVSNALAEAFTEGDRLLVLDRTGDLLHIPLAAGDAAAKSVERATKAFSEMASVSDGQIDAFYLSFADRLADDAIFASISAANARDVRKAHDRGRSTTRLELGASMRAAMIEGLRGWAASESTRGAHVETVRHDGWHIEQYRAGLGVIGFVFEGRPNVFADATGVLKGGNTVVFRIGSAALGTARAIVEAALEPALKTAGLPSGAASLVDDPSHAAGWAMFGDQRLSLAVARGSGPAVDQLGAVAAQAGTPVSLHGTGGAWIVVADDADPDEVTTIVANSLDRKVCNTLNTCCVTRSGAAVLVPAVLAGLDLAADALDTNAKLHVVQGGEPFVPAERFTNKVSIARANGIVDEPSAEMIATDELGIEWEWENSPEITLVIVDDVDDAIGRFNDQSPRLVATLLSGDVLLQNRFNEAIDAPFVGNGFTRWVDGQYALSRPELGLSNWANGRLFGRGGVLSGDSVFTVRTRAFQEHPDQRR